MGNVNKKRQITEGKGHKKESSLISGYHGEQLSVVSETKTDRDTETNTKNTCITPSSKEAMHWFDKV